ncbi:MAG: hypothetical protein LBH43_09635 [Treponema sp.]|jgi:opacity protein-like surface antigen|nr:hypothetical protein [Treponema sp.]
MKKYILSVFLFIATIAVIFGDDFLRRGNFSLSGGMGGILGGHFTRYSIEAGKEYQLKADQKIDQFEYGIFAFFDATFVTFGIAYQGGIYNFDEPLYIDGERFDAFSRNGQGWENVLGFSLLGKFPFQLNDRFTVFPLLGMDYNISLRQRRTAPDGTTYDRTDPPEGVVEYDKNENTFNFSDWNAFFVRIGGGLEVDLTDSFFLRGDFLYGIRLMTEYEKKNLELIKFIANDSEPKLGGLSSGPSLKLSAGWRFYTR